MSCKRKHKNPYDLFSSQNGDYHIDLSGAENMETPETPLKKNIRNPYNQSNFERLSSHSNRNSLRRGSEKLTFHKNIDIITKSGSEVKTPGSERSSYFQNFDRFSKNSDIEEEPTVHVPSEEELSFHSDFRTRSWFRRICSPMREGSIRGSVMT